MIAGACVINGRRKMKKLTTEDFIEKAKKAHGNKYCYDKSAYINATTPLIITCPIHGDFHQTPNSHLSGRGCPKCSNNNVKKTTEEFIADAIKTHGSKYDYSKVKYVNNASKVCIICPEHGEFWQIARNHLNGDGCPKCAIEKRVEKARWDTEKEIHGSKYDYSKANYIGCNEKLTLICPVHGEFQITPSAHLNGKQGCPECGKISSSNAKRLTNETFIEKATEIHGDKYGYSQVIYKDYDTKLRIYCPIHGYFEQSPDSHLHGKGCPRCAHNLSRAEDEICAFLKENNVNFIQRCRDVISPYEIDIYLPDYKIGIEYNGLYWHSSLFKDKDYHLAKTEYAAKNGVYLLQIFEDEMINKKNIVLAKIKHILGLDTTKIMARKCTVKEITYDESKTFMEQNHIQGPAHGTIYLGGFYNDKLISVMIFVMTKDTCELVRFAVLNGVIVTGIGNKFFKYFVKKYSPSKVISFADRRWTTLLKPTLYDKLGFKIEKILPPDYRYYIINGKMVRIHKFNFRKNALHKRYNLPLTMTESEMAEQINAVRIYDCGLIKYVWKSQN